MPHLDIKLVRHPRSLERMSPEIRSQIRDAYEKLAQATILKLHELISDWEHKPSFSYKVTVSKKRYTMYIKYDKRTLGGKRYAWIDKGTGSYREDGTGSAYTIKAKKKKSLYYKLPSKFPKSMAADGTLAPSYTADPGIVQKKSVRHLGIKPRKLSRPIVEHLRSRTPGSFHNETEAAIKRGLRQMGKKT